MTQALINKIALVTGASRGIGQAIALELARQGATVIGTATTETGAATISQTLELNHLNGKGVVLNVTQAEQVEAVLEQIQQQFGAPAILVNNAGITRDNLLLRMDDQEWQEVIDTNLTAAFRLSRLCLKDMLRARWGRIINLTSVIAFTGNAGQANYAAAKAGLVAFTKSMAKEIASRNITCNTVAPGFIETDMTRQLSHDQQQMILQQIPMKRMGSVEEIAYAVSFLASPLASYMTGETLHINGGMLMN